MKDLRKEYIRLLSRSVEQFTPEPGEERDAALIAELADAGYVRGKAYPINTESRALRPRGEYQSPTACS